MKEKKFFSLPITFTEIKDYSYDDSLVPVDIKVLHDGLNLNNSTFYEEAISDASESLKNKPILGYIKKIDGSDKEDFAGHEIEISIGDEGIKTIYLERPLGTVPETNNYSIQEDGDKKFVTCRGYLWKEYLNSGYEVLKDNPNKSVSMEIAVDDYDFNEDGSINITKYRYLGIAILGDDVQPAMSGAELDVIGQFNEKFSKGFYEKIEDLNSKLEQQFGSVTDVNEEDEGGENVEETKFATYNQKREALRNALDSKVIRNDDGDIIEETYYWVSDFDDNVVYVERSHWLEDDYNFDYGKFAYTFDEEKVEATISGEFEKMHLVWLTEEEKTKVEDERNQFAEIKVEYDEMKEKQPKMESDLEELQNYKAKIEEEQLIESQNEIFEIYNELLKDNVSYKEIKDNREDYSVEDLEKELALLYVRSNNKFSKKEKKRNVKINIESEGTNTAVSPYGDIF